MKICQFGFRITNSMPKMLDLNTLTPSFNFFIVHASRKFKRSSRFTPRKGDLSRHHAMHHFHAIMPILLLFDKSRAEKRANHAITPCITFTPLCQLFCCFMNYALKKWLIMPSHQPLEVPPILTPISI